MLQTSSTAAILSECPSIPWFHDPTHRRLTSHMAARLSRLVARVLRTTEADTEGFPQIYMQSKSRQKYRQATIGLSRNHGRPGLSASAACGRHARGLLPSGKQDSALIQSDIPHHPTTLRFAVISLMPMTPFHVTSSIPLPLRVCVSPLSKRRRREPGTTTPPSHPDSVSIQPQ